MAILSLVIIGYLCVSIPFVSVSNCVAGRPYSSEATTAITLTNVLRRVQFYNYFMSGTTELNMLLTATFYLF